MYNATGPGSSGPYAVMFADMSDGTDASDGAADIAKVDVVIAALTALRDVVSAHGGRVVSSTASRLNFAQYCRSSLVSHQTPPEPL